MRDYLHISCEKKVPNFQKIIVQKHAREIEKRSFAAFAWRIILEEYLRHARNERALKGKIEDDRVYRDAEFYLHPVGGRRELAGAYAISFTVHIPVHCEQIVYTYFLPAMQTSSRKPDT